MIKTCQVELDPITLELAKAFDYEFNGLSTFELPKFIPPKDFKIGLIVGNSGSGKTLLLREHFGIPESPVWERNKSIASHFNSFKEATDKLFSIGLSSVPTLCRPYNVLSNGERHRADIARILGDGMICDEFTSVTDRNVAKSICVALKKYIVKNNLKRVILSTCHFDVLDWIEPDFAFNCSTGDFVVNGYSLSEFPKLGEFFIN
jgi:ABC-type ATPase with predicted acetyltransferase domain